ncbi:efflux RND transporter periplasmic adaptor subunit [Engelhardtia mirabilis]|uniref:Multidrug resistance protein MdtA n=1 Tax=Engelhardtia mirabilis TaxID=2528011 RepID=A0A518BHW3_9BACT|nr:Multidrug resistance protein MdtA precursor [Planctomycetes bacterium Pla133]QDV00895.1 Multidrug resistance protein MdtA precursor [Planctomycetes bacterium Pla86]
MKPVLFQVALCAVILALGAAGVSALVASRGEVQVEPREAVVPLVQVQWIELSPLVLEVQSQGMVESAREATIAAEVGGRITRIAAPLESGARVHQGDVLVELDRRDLEIARIAASAAVAEARAALELEQAEAEITRRDLLASGVDEPSALARREPQLARAQARFDSAVAAGEKALLDLERTVLRAPFDAVVDRRLVDAGQVIAAGTPLAQLIATEAYEVALPLGAADLARLEPLGVGEIDGPAVELSVEVDGRPATFSGRVVRTAAQLDPRSRSLMAITRIDAPLDQGSAPLRLGAFASARIAGREIERAATIPTEALRGADQVWIVDADQRLQRRTVQVVQRGTDDVVIESGLSDGERVITSALDLAVDGMAVAVEQPDAPARN